MTLDEILDKINCSWELWRRSDNQGYVFAVFEPMTGERIHFKGSTPMKAIAPALQKYGVRSS